MKKEEEEKKKKSPVDARKETSKQQRKRPHTQEAKWQKTKRKNVKDGWANEDM